MEQSEQAEYSELTEKIIGAAMKVHSAIGPGVLKSVYRTCMAHELKKLGIGVSCEVCSPVIYDGLRLDSGFRIDPLVEDLVVVELKVRGHSASDPQSPVADIPTAVQQIDWLAAELQSSTHARRYSADSQ
jgi:GxxExxY protein